MKATVYLYNCKLLKEEKNFVIEKIDNYLSTSADVSLVDTLTDFQFQRPELYKRIKIDKSQVNILNIGTDEAKPVNYVKITMQYKTGSTNLSVYYYYVLSVKQVAQSTIELEMKMDVLHTYDFVSSLDTTLANRQYTLSERTLVNREHKNRFSNRTESSTRIYAYEDVELGKSLICTCRSLRFNSLLSDGQSHGFQLQRLALNINTSIDDCCLYSLKIVNNDGEVVWSTNPTNTNGGFFTVRYDSVNKILIVGCEYYTGIMPFLWANTKFEDYDIEPEEVDELNIVFTIEQLPKYNGNNTSYLNNLNSLLQNLAFSYLDYSFYRIIDRYPEGLECSLFKNSSDESPLLDNDGYSTWYVAYASENAVVSSATDTEATYVNPVKVLFYKSLGYSISSQTAKVVRIYPQSLPATPNRGDWLQIKLDELPSGGYIKVGTQTLDNTGYVVGGVPYYVIWLYKKNDNQSQFNYWGYSDSPHYDSAPDSIVQVEHDIPYCDCYGLHQGYLFSGTGDGSIFNVYEGTFYIGSNASNEDESSPRFDNVDLTNPQLIKIINFPYAPNEGLVNVNAVPSGFTWNGTAQALELSSARQNGFDRTLKFSPNGELQLRQYNPFVDLQFNYGEVSGDLYKQAKSHNNESKLYHSDYYLNKFVYDSFGFGFRLEEMNITTFKTYWALTHDFRVRYVCSGNVNSKFVFQFIDYVCDREVQDFNNVLIVERNNEVALFNNAYINYIRSGGYKADTKNADSQKLTNGLTIALSTIGAIASFASSGASGGVGVAAGIGLTIGTATKTISAIESAQRTDRAISQKLLSTSQQSTSVSTCEDIDVMKSYNSNKARLVHYRASDYMANALYDLFYYFGYKCHDYKIPNVNTRGNFNFVQADIVFGRYCFPDDIANEIKNKWNQGITFFHKKPSANQWDVAQEYENLENNLIEWLSE